MTRPRSDDARAPLRGREVELANLVDHLEQLASGTGTIVVVEGDAGVGKSALLGEVAAIARRMSIRVGSAVADPGDRLVHLGALMEALFDGPTPLLERAELAEALAWPEQRYWLLRRLEALLERAALEQPVLVCLDDAQWSDGGTAAALRTLPARLATVPIAWIVALRPGPRSRELRSAIEDLERAGADRIVLGPLDQAGVTQVTADILVAEPDGELLVVAAGAGGNPALLVELIGGLREEALVRVESGRAELVQSQLPRRVSDSVRRRLDRVSESARQVAMVAAALGRSFSLDDVAAMLDQSAAVLLTPVQELIDVGMLTEREDQLAFRHDLAREAVRASAPRSLSRALDRQAAAVLLAAGALPLDVATQLAASAEPGDEVAITTLSKAAETLGASDPLAAAELSQRALQLTPGQHPLRGPLVAATAVWLHAAARGEEAKTFADAALRAVLPPEQEAIVRLGVAGMFAISHDLRAEVSREALALPDLSDDLRARHLAFLFHNLMSAGRLADAHAVSDEATSAVMASRDVAGRFVVELTESGLAYAEGRFGPALELTERALRTGLEVRDDTRRLLARQWRCEVLTVVDRLDESLQLATENVVVAQRDRQGWAHNVFENGRGRLLLQMGRLAEASVVLEARFTPDRSDEFVTVVDAAGVAALGQIALHRGDPRLARHSTEIAQVMFGQSAPSVRRHAVWFLALQAMADGDPHGAHRWLCAVGDDERTSILPRFPMDAADEARLLHIALAAGDHELAAVAAAAAQQRAHLNPEVRSVVAAAAHVTGLLTHSRDDLAEAVELYEGGGRPLALAAALEDLGIVTVDAGDSQQGVDVFGRALVLYTDAGAARDARRVRARLRGLGVRRRLVSASRPQSGWAAMTDSELGVARLVAQGYTNREVAERLFVSRHTVSGHLRSVFAKLDVNSRVELTRLAALHDSPG
jgi:DNA-binding CsgD family transcriptional regulator